MAEEEKIPKAETGDTSLTSIMHVFKNDVSKVLNWVFANNQLAARVRFYLCISILLLVWLGMSLTLHPPRLRADLAQSVLTFLLSFFAPDVLSYIVLFAFPFLLMWWLAAIYLDDIFELNDFSVARKFILQASFATSYHSVKIKEGDIDPEDKKSPLILIGGPGYVNVFMENAAVFEKADGSVRILSPITPQDKEKWWLQLLSGSSKFKRSIDGFERLRQVIDLRNQNLELNIPARTRDGVEICAEDVRVLFSIYRGKKKPEESEEMPMPFYYDEDAIKQIVYGQSRSKLDVVVTNLVTKNVRDFISQHDLIELLACNASDKGISPYHFVLREEMARQLDHQFRQAADKNGVQIEWIGLGTWKASIPKVEEDLVYFWDVKNKIDSQFSDEELNYIYLNAYYEELQRLMISPVEVLYHYIFQEQKGTRFDLNLSAQFHTTEKMAEEIKRSIAKTLRVNLYQAWKLHHDEGKTIDEVDKALRHLNSLTAYNIGED